MTQFKRRDFIKTVAVGAAGISFSGLPSFSCSSILGRGEWVQYRENIPLKEYVKLKDEFTAKKFYADLITDMALGAGMKFVTRID